MTVEFWLINGKDRLRLPVNPESNSYTSPFSYEEVDVAGLGEITRIGYHGEDEFQISTFWPATYNSVYCSYSGFISPSSFVSKIKSWRDARKPIQFVVTGAGGVNTKVTIRDLQVDGEKFGSPGDIYFTLSLKEYREVTIKTATVTTPKSSSKKRPSSSKSKSKTYTVKKGDCLWKISKRYYGKGSEWRKIYNANKKVIGKNPDLIYPGQKFVIPS